MRDVKEKVLRALTILPEDMSAWAKDVSRLNKEVRSVHPDYPELTDMQLMSYIKRLLPRLRDRIKKV